MALGTDNVSNDWFIDVIMFNIDEISSKFVNRGEVISPPIWSHMQYFDDRFSIMLE